MRRALLLPTLLAAPSLGAAQATGQVTFANGRTFPMYVNATECNPANGSTVVARWTPLFINAASPPPDGTYAIYGSNIAPVNNTCYTQSSTTGTVVTAGSVADQDGNLSGTSATISTSALIGVAGKSCTDDGQAIWICVQGISSTGNFALSKSGNQRIFPV